MALPKALQDHVNASIPEKYLDYLDELRELGDTNMYGAAPYLVAEFGLPKEEARTVLSHWMKTFSERKKAAI